MSRSQAARVSDESRPQSTTVQPSSSARIHTFTWLRRTGSGILAHSTPGATSTASPGAGGSSNGNWMRSAESIPSFIGGGPSIGQRSGRWLTHVLRECASGPLASRWQAAISQPVSQVSGQPIGWVAKSTAWGGLPQKPAHRTSVGLPSQRGQSPRAFQELDHAKSEAPAGASVSRWEIASSTPGQSLLLKLTEICRPSELLFPPQGPKIGPGVKPCVVPIVEDDAHRVVPDRTQIRNFHMALARNRNPLVRAVALHLGGWAHHAQHLGCQLVALAIFENHLERITVGAELEIGRVDAAAPR